LLRRFVSIITDQGSVCEVDGGTGGPIQVEKVSIENLKQKNVKTSWLPVFEHPSIPVEERTSMAEGMVSGMLLGIHVGAFNVSDEWNRLLPDMKMERSEDFLTEFWEGKP
jgi:hypothetical protein